MAKYHEEIMTINGTSEKEILYGKSHIFVKDTKILIPKTVDFRFAVHRHSFYAVEYIYDGECTQFINGREYKCPSGTICLLSPLDEHCFMNKSGKNVKMFFLTFGDDVIFNDVWEELGIDSTPFFCVLNENDNKKLKEEFFLLEKEYNNPQFLGNAFIKSKVNQIIINIIRNALPRETPHRNKFNSIYGSISYIRYKYRENISLEEISKLCHVTQSHFCKYFKKYTGVSFKEYIVNLRLDYAMRQITGTDKSITEICYDSGFSSPSYFTKAFFKRFGKKPSEAKNNHNK